MVTLSTLLMSALTQAGGVTAPATDSGLISSAAIGAGSSTAIMIALAVITIGAVASVVAGDRCRRREAEHRSHQP